MDDASSDGVSDESSEDEHVATRAHFFSRTLGDGWLEVEPGIYLQRGEVVRTRACRRARRTAWTTRSPARCRPGSRTAAATDEHDEASGRLRRWLHR